MSGATPTFSINECILYKPVYSRLNFQTFLMLVEEGRYQRETDPDSPRTPALQVRRPACGLTSSGKVNFGWRRLAGAAVAANLYIREYVPMGIDSLRFRSESIPMGTF